MSVLTEGRFEMGIGTGRPGIEDELRELGMPVASPRQRLAACARRWRHCVIWTAPTFTRRSSWPSVGKVPASSLRKRMSRSGSAARAAPIVTFAGQNSRGSSAP